jgi:hypothetical protein
VPVDEKLFRTVRVRDGVPITEETLLLLSKEHMRENAIDALWKAYFVDCQVRGALESLFGPAPDPALVRLISKRLPKLASGDVRAGLSRVRVQLDFPTIDRQAEPDRLPRREAAQPEPDPGPDRRAAGEVSLQTLIGAGLITPPLELTKTYKGKRFSARVESDGQIAFDGQRYPSLSMVASAARRTVLGRLPATNGWVFWQFRDTDGQMKVVDSLRQRYLDSIQGPDETR